jgi:hypothetical protein
LDTVKGYIWSRLMVIGRGHAVCTGQAGGQAQRLHLAYRDKQVPVSGHLVEHHVLDEVIVSLR